MQLLIVPRSVPVTRTRLVTGCHDSVTKVRGCHVVTNHQQTPVMSARVTTLHPLLVTFANINTKMRRQDTRSLSPQIFISECVSTRFLLLLAGKMFVWTTVFLFTLYLRLVVSTVTKRKYISLDLKTNLYLNI